MTQSTETAEGRQAYDENCAVCHGPDATGTGPAADTLDEVPPDLTTLAARHGGDFPATAVMATVWGDESTSHRATMPEFADMFVDDPLVRYDGGDGIPSPTPLGLVQIAEFLRSIQD